MNSFKDLGKGAYTLLFVAPLFWLVPTLIEGLQHVVEVQLGFFTPGDGIQGHTETTIRLIFGFLKVMSILVPVLLILKLSAQGWRQSRLFPLTALENKALTLTTVLVLSLLVFVSFFGSQFSQWLTTVISIPKDLAPFTPLLVILMPFAIFRAQITGAVLQIAGVELDGKLGVKSYVCELFSLIYVALLVTGPMYLHYQINNWARGTDGWQLFGLLALDSILVGLMALLIGLAMRLAITSVYGRELKAAAV